MHVRSIAVMLALLVVAVGGFVVVRELTKPAPLKPVPTILVNPDPDPDPSARREARDRREERARRRREDRRGDRSGQEPAPAPQATTPVPQLDPLEPGDDGSDDGGGD